MKILTPIKNKKNIDTLKYKFFVFDTETTKLEPMPKNFVFGVLYGWNFQKIIFTIKDFKNEFKKKKYKGKFIFAHNAEFDLLTIYGNLYTNVDSKAIFNGKFISAKKDGVTFADSMNIYPSSVEKIGEIIGIKKLENEKVKTNKLSKQNVSSDDIKYCIRDCEIVYTALLNMFESIGVIKITLASLSMYNFRNKFLEKRIYISPLNEQFFESYYGGRTEAFKIGNCYAKVYDFNSMYTSVMTDCIFPDISNLKSVSKLDVKYLYYLLNHFEGMAKVTVQHDKSYFGYLPYKTEKRGKLLFPIGKFTTTLNFNELRFAINSGKIKILDCEFAIYGNKVNSPFSEFAKYHYSERKLTDNDLLRLIHKTIPNSLYGKFAMRMKFNTEYFEHIPFEIIGELEKTEKFYNLKLFSESREDCFLITENEKFKNSFFAIPTYSSYITSEARIRLLKNLLANENENVVYCDTDSIFLEGNFIGNIGNELGEFKLENKICLQVCGLKHYIYKDEKGTHELIKGVHKNARKVGDNYISLKYYKTKESLRRNKNAGESFEMIKKLSGKYDKRNILHNGNTSPVAI